MDRTHTFDLQDLDDAFWKSVVFYQIYPSSGMGGPGCLCLVTEDKKMYVLGFEGISFSEFDLGKKFPFFGRKKEYNDRDMIDETDNRVWKRVLRNIAFVREDIWPAFQATWDNEELVKEKVVFSYSNIPDIVGLAIGAESLERLDYIEWALFREEMNRKMAAIEAEHERNKLTEEHFEWKPFYINNIKSNEQGGWYALLFTEKDGVISGAKFSIVFQRHQALLRGHAYVSDQDEIELYHLYKKTYYDVIGPLEYPPCKDERQEELWEKKYGDNGTASKGHNLAFFDWITLDDADVNRYGKFMRSFKSLEEAKEYAMCFANANSHIYGDKNTIIKGVYDAKRDHECRVKRYDAYLAYRKNYKKILDVICDYDGYPSKSSGGGGFLFDAVLEMVPEITKEQLSIIWQDIPRVLEKRTQQYIEEEKQESLQFMDEMEKSQEE